MEKKEEACSTLKKQFIIKFIIKLHLVFGIYLKGNKYTFADVEYVNTGFNEGWINKGEFFYNIQFKDGKKLKLAHPSSTQLSRKYEYDTWQEYVDIDKYIMDARAKKESSENGVEHVKMDKVYVDKLLKVVRNK